MEHIAAIMLLVGCSQGSLACEELPAPQVAYESLEECVGALPSALGGASAVSRIVHARCAVVDPAWSEEDVEVSWRMSRENGLEVDVRQIIPPADGVVVAENSLSVDLSVRMH